MVIVVQEGVLMSSNINNNVTDCLKELLVEFSNKVIVKGNYQCVIEELLPKYTKLVLLQSKEKDGRMVLTTDVAGKIKKGNSIYNKNSGRGFYCNEKGEACLPVSSFAEEDIRVKAEEYPYIIWYEGALNV